MLKNIRTMTGLTQLSFAEKTGVSHHTIIAVECGNRLMSMDVMEQISERLNIPLASMVIGQFEEKDFNGDIKFSPFSLVDKDVYKKMISFIIKK